MSKDKYLSYYDLKEEQKEGVDYLIEKECRSTDIAIFAPHGGRIEPGTSEIARAIAGRELTYYCFIGKKSSGNRCLHIASEKFDEPEGIKIARTSETVITIHGCYGNHDYVYIGGLDDDLKDRLCNDLNATGLNVSTDVPYGMAGRNIDNICNKGRTGKGVQIEISKSLRRQMLNEPVYESNKNNGTDLNTLIATIRHVVKSSI